VARLGYGDSVTATTVSFGPQSTNKFVTTYFRRPFVVPRNVVITNLNLRVAQADGAVVWFDGQEIYRTNLPAGPISYTNLALSALTYYPRYIFLSDQRAGDFVGGHELDRCRNSFEFPDGFSHGF